MAAPKQVEITITTTQTVVLGQALHQPIPTPHVPTSFGDAEKQFDGQPLRRQLFCMYGGCSTIAFVILFGLCTQLIFASVRTTRSTATSELTNQVVRNDGIILSDASMVLAETLSAGARSLASPVAVAIFDVHDTTITYSLEPTRSYADASVSTLAPPLTRHARYTCNPSAADATLRGCDGFGTALVSTTASSVYLRRFMADGSNAQAEMDNHAAECVTLRPRSSAL